MPRMTHRACKPIIYVSRMLTKASIRQNLTQIVTFGAKRVRPGDGQVRIWEQVSDAAAGRGRLAEFVATLE